MTAPSPEDEIARATSERGEVVLRRRGDEIELRVNGVFVMDTAETSTERLLAEIGLESTGVRSSPRTVVVAGLGLGYTAALVLDHPSVEEMIVIEIEPDLVGWHRDGLIPQASGVLDDPRTRVVIGDVRQAVRRLTSSSADVILLDVDNGPGFLVYDDNSAVYEHAFLADCRRVLRPGGSVAVWSSADSAPLSAVLRAVFDETENRAVPVRLGRRDETYHLFVGRRDVAR